MVERASGQQGSSLSRHVNQYPAVAPRVPAVLLFFGSHPLLRTNIRRVRRDALYRASSRHFGQIAWLEYRFQYREELLLGLPGRTAGRRPRPDDRKWIDRR